MGKLTFLLTLSIVGFVSCKASYNNDIPEVTPKTIKELKKALCNKSSSGLCVDDEPLRIIIDGLLDFTGSEGYVTELGCYHLSEPEICLTAGQKKLNVDDQCRGLTPTNVTYSKAGKLGLTVGSNKIIVGQNHGWLKGRGLRLKYSKNVQIRNLKISDINPEVIWGGDAIDLIQVTNVLIDSCYFKNIGRQMIVSHYDGSVNVTISNNTFDGRTPFSAYCDGSHYWLWLFLGKGDQITIVRNTIFNTAGRGPHLLSKNGNKSLIHISQNTFTDVSHLGLVESYDTYSSVLLEGNVYKNVSMVVHYNTANVFMVKDAKDQELCQSYLGRPCLTNSVESSGGMDFVNSEQVLKDFEQIE